MNSRYDKINRFTKIYKNLLTVYVEYFYEKDLFCRKSKQVTSGLFSYYCYGNIIKDIKLSDLENYSHNSQK